MHALHLLLRAFFCCFMAGKLFLLCAEKVVGRSRQRQWSALPTHLNEGISV